MTHSCHWQKAPGGNKTQLVDNVRRTAEWLQGQDVGEDSEPAPAIIDDTHTANGASASVCVGSDHLKDYDIYLPDGGDCANSVGFRWSS
eukprot:CAMPEP_0174358310 /NCGR_PEP_ID=MMETSP0811_2-20130205/41842_1 /TAXON_ID=73025 ORGANISM="Eutreptiella gymnastica-like, Strain CCMP1594" /NCGR_SAMPLE_ID=MMETSP0811_2 /ASSEMBLY_ACC=CAM_ASM_000667 /LENGTH=88 /DNA_ID=CAMNT_0015491971 /DNA_START=66 /DNA_END=328 /DNA_ORIENTATION=-